MKNLRQIRARFDGQSIVVYQAFNHAIANAALDAQRFVPPFSYGRMTWVKPSFLWMMERCGWATKANQERVLAVYLRRDRFEQALAQSRSTEAGNGGAQVLVQWDPERSLRGGKLELRSLQLGLGRTVCEAYATKWVTRIEDVSALAHQLARLRREGDFEHAQRLLPVERPYPLSADLARHLNATA